MLASYAQRDYRDSLYTVLFKNCIEVLKGEPAALRKSDPDWLITMAVDLLI